MHLATGSGGATHLLSQFVLLDWPEERLRCFTYLVLRLLTIVDSLCTALVFACAAAGVLALLLKRASYYERSIR